MRVALDNAEGATTGRRSARAALHLLAAVAASSGFAADASFAQEWLRVRCECAGVAGWTVAGTADDDARVDGALLGAHVASLHAALVALVAPGAPQPDKQVFGAALGEAVRAAATLLASPEDGCDEDNDDEDDSDGEDDSDSEDDSDDGLENETEEEFLERYAAIARDMADGTADRYDDRYDDDDEGCDEEDSAYQVAFEATRGDGSRDAAAFAAWFETWRAGDTRGVRVSSVVHGAAAKALAKAAAR